MLAKEDSNLLVGAALPAQLPNHFGVLFELRARRPFGNLVEQLANSLIHRKHLSVRSDLRRQAEQTRIQFEQIANSNRFRSDYNRIPASADRTARDRYVTPCFFA